MQNTTLRGKIVKEYLKKFPTLGSHTLAKLIYSRDDNYKLFNSSESVRAVIRYYKGTSGVFNRKNLKHD